MLHGEIFIILLVLQTVEKLEKKFSLKFKKNVPNIFGSYFLIINVRLFKL